MISTVQFVRAWIHTTIGNERAAGMVEYALVIALVALVGIAGLTLLGNQIDDTFTNIEGELDAAGS